MVRHVLRNALIPILTHVVVAIPFLFTGSLLLESFFGIPGLGALTVDAIQGNDFSTLRDMVYIGALLFIVGQIAHRLQLHARRSARAARVARGGARRLERASSLLLVAGGARLAWRACAREPVLARGARASSCGAGARSRSSAIALYVRRSALARLDRLDRRASGPGRWPRHGRARSSTASFARRLPGAQLLGAARATSSSTAAQPLRHPGAHLLGTDILGRDVVYRTLKGARVALLIGGLTSLIVIPLALLFGVSAGYFGGRIDDAVFFVMSTLASMPEPAAADRADHGARRGHRAGVRRAGRDGLGAASAASRAARRSSCASSTTCRRRARSASPTRASSCATSCPT